ncbi:hypothetical protein CDAR_274181 [Caerostris darwini]|uniref:Uncharacterized protein n=1 Tax=Caerostris darwini TaxID=1538125 RepID=A0AAV4RDQ8_9ARAC|nr:hypothetical protein CDAR_274181 [Caerostris darwini]
MGVLPAIYTSSGFQPEPHWTLAAHFVTEFNSASRIAIVFREQGQRDSLNPVRLRTMNDREIRYFNLSLRATGTEPSLLPDREGRGRRISIKRDEKYRVLERN